MMASMDSGFLALVCCEDEQVINMSGERSFDLMPSWPWPWREKAFLSL